MPNIDSIRHYISTYPGVKVGFTIYRLTYSDDDSWTRYMHHLNERMRLNLSEDGDDDIFPHIDWDVQEDPSLQDADDETVRKFVRSLFTSIEYLADHT
jgi:hypothetical protein